MSRNAFAAAGLAASLILSGPAARAGEAGSKTFIVAAIAGNLAEIALGNLAQKNAGSADVRTFGLDMVADHGDANKTAIAAAKKLGVMPPTAPTAAQKRVYDRLAAETGPDFDRDFIDVMVQDHMANVKDYHLESSNGGGPVSDYARLTLPKISKHLQMAQTLSTRLPPKRNKT